MTSVDAKHWDTPEGIPTAAELQRRARALAPGIRRRASRTEAERHVPPESIEELLDAGLARILTPRRWGGYELDFNTAADIAVTLGRACGSTAWCLSLFNVHAWMLALMSQAAQAEVWSTGPDALIATAAPSGQPLRVAGGYRLSGNWPWSSGVGHADWVILAARHLPESSADDAEVVLFLLPRNDYAVTDTWYNVGLRGSGSDNVVVVDAFVPEHRTATVRDLREAHASDRRSNTGRLYQIAMSGIMPSALVTPAIGIARGAYEDWRAWTAGKIARFTGGRVAASVSAQILLAESAADIDAGEMLVRRAIAVAERGGVLTPAQVARNRRDYAYSARLFVRALDGLLRSGGSGALFDSNPVQRAWRDVHAVAAHVSLHFDAAGEAFARNELGLEPSSGEPLI